MLSVVGARRSADVVKLINECVDVCCSKPETKAQNMRIIGGADMSETTRCRCDGVLQLKAPRERRAEGGRAERDKAKEAGPEGEHGVRLSLFYGRRAAEDIRVPAQRFRYIYTPR